MLNNKATLIVINSNIEYIFIKSRNDWSDLVSYKLSDPDWISSAFNFPPSPSPETLITTAMAMIIRIIVNTY